MLFRDITILNENFEVEEHRYVGVRGTKIEYVGADEPQEDYGRTVEGKGRLLMPGFFNAHGHSPMSLVRGYGENMLLQDWLNDKIFPFEDKLNGRAVYWGTLLSMAEGLKFGIVSHSDMYFFVDDMVEAVIAAGCKANISRAIAHFDDSDPWENPRFKEVKRTFNAYNGIEGGRIKMDAGIHAEYTCTPVAVRAISEFAKEHDAIMHIHISESKREHEECKARHGKTPAQFFLDMGTFDTKVLAAHCVWLEDEDIAIMKEKGASIAINTASNMKLASGSANVPRFLKEGINVAIGTDSVASNNSLNFFEEMKLFALLPKLTFGDPTAVTPKETLYAATRGGALAQGRLNSGLLKEGYDADLILLDISGPNMHPVHDMLTNLVYSMSGSDVLMTMADGTVLYENGEYRDIDVEKTAYEVKRSVDYILSQL
ncbi:MAG: amidohydrolase [Firmicutes bacterium]|nr:amidohydrolase [Bacillota bacterium]